ncbi:sushi, von Willebrand factor type A, EGF and pentraxin domain-containing protein 1-like [Gopherus flavomarginatus]|uniref:sushi, von Willebrand factor type A, EGF and pentraxin domain-containing protein 1-like n=1 Tax=Gopherus flavomarginatus TaxID=286002 RepID=UPI0021CC4967|nr:sushi, von Willebrand factor type A, EGF and pentraxin domain-containing protein 1-like [Gopherus flavomarginatus]
MLLPSLRDPACFPPPLGSGLFPWHPSEAVELCQQPLAPNDAKHVPMTCCSPFVSGVVAIPSHFQPALSPGTFLFSVNCGRPEADFNSMVYGNDWWVGSVVRYGCRPGFLLVGNPARACQSDGHWTPKPTCLRICLQGRIEINERDIDGSCSSTCTDKAHLRAFLNHGCIKISNCVTKQWSWTRWFVRCDFCECDCYVPCSSSG